MQSAPAPRQVVSTGRSSSRSQHGNHLSGGVVRDVHHTSLLRSDGGLIRIVTVWRSRDDLDRHLVCVDKPFAVGPLESAGGDTVVEVLELVLDSNTAWWP